MASRRPSSTEISSSGSLAVPKSGRHTVALRYEKKISDSSSDGVHKSMHGNEYFMVDHD